MILLDKLAANLGKVSEKYSESALLSVVRCEVLYRSQFGLPVLPEFSLQKNRCTLEWKLKELLLSITQVWLICHAFHKDVLFLCLLGISGGTTPVHKGLEHLCTEMILNMQSRIPLTQTFVKNLSIHAQVYPFFLIIVQGFLFDRK